MEISQDFEHGDVSLQSDANFPNLHLLPGTMRQNKTMLTFKIYTKKFQHNKNVPHKNDFFVDSFSIRRKWQLATSGVFKPLIVLKMPLKRKNAVFLNWKVLEVFSQKNLPNKMANLRNKLSWYSFYNELANLTICKNKSSFLPRKMYLLY